MGIAEGKAAGSSLTAQDRKQLLMLAVMWYPPALAERSAAHALAGIVYISSVVYHQLLVCSGAEEQGLRPPLRHLEPRRGAVHW